MKISRDKDLPSGCVVDLFRSLDWESAKHPERLERAIAGSSVVRSLWDGELLAGIATAVSDGAMCAYFPYVAVRPGYQGMGWGRKLLESALEEFEGFVHVALIAYADKGSFYERCGFTGDDGKKPYFFGVAGGSAVASAE